MHVQLCPAHLCRPSKDPNQRCRQCVAELESDRADAMGCRQALLDCDPLCDCRRMCGYVLRGQEALR